MTVSFLRFLRITRQRLRAVSRQDALDAELDRELAFHLDQLAAEYIADGMTPDEARHAAKRALGNMPLVAEQCRDHRGVSWLHDFRRDVAFGLRVLVRNPTVSCVIVASLALGIGANTAVLGAIDAITRIRVPVPDAERVVVARTYRQDAPGQRSPVTIADYFAWAEENQSLASIGLSLGNQADFGDDDGMPAERILGVAVTAELFSVLQVTPALGRVYTDEEVQRAQPDVPIVLSHRLWQRRFAGAADVIGSRFRMNRRTAYVVGVMPERFHYPGAAVDYWVPLTPNRSDAQSPQRLFGVTARLKPGVTAEQAEADLNRIAEHLSIERPDRHAGWQVRIDSIRDAMFGWTSQPLWTLEAAVALVLLVACTNVAGLLLARGVARRAEITVRAALGASRGRLVRQLVAETTVLAAAGGALGILVAWFGVRTLSTLIPPPGAAGMVDVTLDARIVAVAALISIASGVIFGILPALAGSRWDISEFRKGRWREALVAAQIAVTFVLMIGAGLLTRSFLVVIARDVQFDPERLLTFQLNVPIGDFMQRRGVVGDRPYFEITPSPALMFERVHEGLKAMPGAASVAGASVQIVNALVVPMTDVRPSPTDPGAPSSTAAVETLPTAYFFVTPEFFTNIGARLLRGRDVEARDTVSSAWVAVVNESAARQLWPGVDPIGRQLTIVGVPEERPREVVGVVADIPLAVPQQDARPVIYLSYLQQPGWYPLPGANLFGSMTFMIRTAGDPMALVPAARRVVAAIDPDRPISSVGTMAGQLRARVPRRADYLAILGAFAAAAMLLAAIGIYGIVSYTAACRTREIGVRMALGARAYDIVRLVGRRALLLVGVGVGAGLAGALALTQLLRSQLWEITPTDPVTYAAASVLLLLVCTAACALPTRRATAVNPTIALRCE
jgi:putative ABC transport system permease protein